jgi:hypothetical protein
VFDSGLRSIQLSSFVGGGENRVAWTNDSANALAIGPDHDVYAAGISTSRELPVSPGAFRQAPAGNMEVFVLRLRFP